MKCHYEILSIARDSDDNTIKTAYRKAALRWHPDKNLSNADEAKDQFQLIQQAYDVLSDPHERAWYDNHREQILRGSQSDYEDKSLDVYQYFTASCYRGFDDSPMSFYTIYRQIFEKIACEDIEFMECDDEFKSIPLFGKSSSDYDTIVGPFYAYWQSYCTKKSYSWLCPHNVSEIRDRRLLREIEKETKKIAQKARRERNDEIRALVAFVRKRDKRVIEHKKVLEERAEQNRMKQHEKRLEQLRKYRKDAADMQQQHAKTFCTDGHEEKLRQMEDLYASTDDEEDEGNENGDGENFSNYLNGSDIGDVLNGAEPLDITTDNADNINATTVDPLSDFGYCIACDKSFKNHKSLQNHLSSKRHIENQRAHDILMNSSTAPSSDDNHSIDEILSDNVDCLTDEQENNDEKIEIEIKRKSNKNKSKKKTKAKIIAHQDVDSEQEENEILDLLQRNSAADEEKNGAWSDDGGKKTKKSSKTKKSAAKSDAKPKTPTTESNVKQKCTTNTLQNSKITEPPTEAAEKSIDLNLTCVTCKSIFSSKNKLFNHLKVTGHGVYIDKKNFDATATTTAAAAAGTNGHQSQKRIKKKQFYSKVTL